MNGIHNRNGMLAINIDKVTHEAALDAIRNAGSETDIIRVTSDNGMPPDFTIMLLEALA